MPDLAPVPDSPVLLGIDTAGTSGTIALARIFGNHVEVLGQRELTGRSYSSQLVATLGEMLHKHSVELPKIGAIVVTKGPGSFTGVRVGLSVVKGLAEVTNLPIIALSRLAVLAHLSALDPALAVLDAARGEYYAGEYSNGLCVRESLVSKDQIIAATAGGLRCAICEDRVAERLAPLNPYFIPPLSATAAIRAALPRFRAADFDDAEILDANYLRRSDAELFHRTPVRAEAHMSTLTPALAE